MYGKSPVLDRLISEQSYERFYREKSRFVLRTLLITAAVIFCLESLVMIAIESYWSVPRPFDLFIDGLILVAALFPLNYYFIVRPMSNEIDKHYRTNQELIKSYQLVERFFSINDVLIAHMDADFNFIRVNQAYADADQHEISYFIGKNHFDLFPNEENQMIFERAVQTGKAYSIADKPFEYADNPERGITYWDWSLLPIKDSKGQVIQLLFVLNDVTSRKRAQIALSESERRFQAVFNQTFQHMGLLDKSGGTLLLNQTALLFLGHSIDKVAGLPFWRLPWWAVPSDAVISPAEQLQAAVDQAAQGEVVHCELSVKPAMGEPAILDITFKPLLDVKGSTSLIIYEGRDITERIRSEQALMKSEKQIQRLYQAEMMAHERADVLRRAVQALSGSLSSSNVLEILLDNVHKVVAFNSAHILLIEDEDHLVVRLARGEEQWEEQERLLDKRFEMRDYPFFDRVLKEHETIFVSDTCLNRAAVFFREAPFILSWMAIPLQAGDQVIGLCILEHRCPGFFTEDLVQWAVTLTGQAAVAIHNAWLFEQVRDNREHLQTLSRGLVEAQEHERHYIARELHDDAGQALASLMFGLRHLELDSGDQAAVIEHCKELRQITDGVIENLHRLAINLRPATLDHLGLVAALRQHAETVSAQHGLAIQFEAIGNIERLSEETETAIYRIVQESLTNIIRHSQATRADILLERRDHNLIVVVEDNGIGFDPQAPVVNHLGLLGMRERAEMLSGALTIESSHGKGSTIVLEVPCPSES